MAMAADRRLFVLLVFTALPFILSAQSILERQVEVHVQRIRLSQALDLVARDGGFKLSYNAASLPVDSIVTVNAKGTVKEVMSRLLGPELVLKESGDHLILLAKGGAKRKFKVKGLVVDGATGAPVSRASVFEVNERNASVTDGRGGFSIGLSGVRDRTPLLVSKKGYSDTIIFVGRNEEIPSVILRAHERLDALEPLCAYDRCVVEDLGVTRLLVPDQQLYMADDPSMEEVRTVQFSLLPNIGTNKDISGIVVNKVSFNLLAGYSRGLEGLEIGIGVNMERRDVNGVQFAGLGNLVGRNTKGVQVAGGLNHTMRSLEGLQLSGFGNTVWDTLSGAQVAGGANVVKGGMQGTQVAGACNVTTHDCNGVQVAGGVNVTVGDVQKTQVAGGVNYARSVSGLQFAGGVNVAIGSVGGGQVGLGVNYARSVTGGQVSLGLNVVSDSVRGGQVGVLNFARISNGGQVGILNFSDRITGTSVGILSFAWHGYHRFDVVTSDAMALSLQLRTGTRGFHNILGYSPSVTPDERWGFFYGFGSELRIGKRGFFNIDLTGEQVVEQREWVDAVNILGRFGVNYGYHVAGPVVVSGGPLFNMLATDWHDVDTGAYLSGLAPAEPATEWTSGTTRFSGWFGWRAAVGLSF